MSGSKKATASAGKGIPFQFVLVYHPYPGNRKENLEKISKNNAEPIYILSIFL